MSTELALLGEILRLADDPDASLNEFHERVASSPQLAAEIVRVSNSALYGMAGKISRLDRAVLILGRSAVASIASSILVARELSGIDIGGSGPDALWIHSLETGCCAELVARCLGLPCESEAYLAGLLHEMGVPDLYRAHGEPYRDLLVRAGDGSERLENLEQERFGIDHAQRMHGLAEEWGFPQSLRLAIEYHHRPLDAPSEQRGVASLIYAAHAIVTEPREGWNDRPDAQEGAHFLSELGLTGDDLEDIRALLEERIKELASVLAVSSAA